jgi:predicted dehydrogenase
MCDVDQSRLTQAPKELPAEAQAEKIDLLSDFRRLIDRADIDVVVVATPDHWHAIPALQAMRAGKDVYLEKPVAHTIEEGQMLVKTARGHNRVLQVGLQQRSQEAFLEAEKVLRSGQIGSISAVHCFNVWNQTDPALTSYSISEIRTPTGREIGLGNPPDSAAPPGVDYDMWLGPAPKRPFNPARFHWNYIYFWDYSGGMQLIWMVHLFDSVRQMMDLKGPKSVHTSAGTFVMRDIRETPDTVITTLDYPNLTVICSILHTSGFTFGGGRYDHGIQFIGSKATLMVDRFGYQVLPEAKKPELIRTDTPNTGTLKHVENFLTCVRTRKKPACDIEEGHISTTALHLANISYRTGRKVFWDSEKEQIIGDPEAASFARKEYRDPWSLA